MATVYQLNLSTPYRVDGVTPNMKELVVWHNDPTFTLTNSAGTPVIEYWGGYKFSADGGKMFVIDCYDISGRGTNTVIYEWQLATPFDISTASYVEGYPIVPASTVNGFCFNDDGTKIFFGGYNTIYEMTMSSPWDLSTASLTLTLAVGSFTSVGYIYNMQFSDNGTVLVFEASDRIFKLATNSPYLLTTTTSVTLVLDDEVSVNGAPSIYSLFGWSEFEIIEGGPWREISMCARPDGTKIFISDTVRVKQLSMSTPWDFSTIKDDNKDITIGDLPDRTHILFNENGSSFYTGGRYTPTLYQWSTNGTALIDVASDTDPGFVNTEDGGDTNPYTNDQKMSYTVQAGDALPPGHYYWRARGKDPSGSNTWGDWSEVREFDVAFTPGVVYDNVNLSEGFRVYREFGREPRGPQKYRNRATHADILAKTNRATGGRVVW
jgi:hypothetical protein